MKAQSLPSLSLAALLLLAALPATAAESHRIQKAYEFIREAVQNISVTAGVGEVERFSLKQGGGIHDVVPVVALQQDSLFTLGGIRFNVMGTTLNVMDTPDNALPIEAGSNKAGLHVSLFYLLNAISDQGSSLMGQDYVLSFNLPF